MKKVNKRKFNKFVGKNSIFRCDFTENIYYDDKTKKMYVRTKRPFLALSVMVIPVLYLIFLLENMIKSIFTTNKEIINFCKEYYKNEHEMHIDTYKTSKFIESCGEIDV